MQSSHCISYKWAAVQHKGVTEVLYTESYSLQKYVVSVKTIKTLWLLQTQGTNNAIFLFLVHDGCGLILPSVFEKKTNRSRSTEQSCKDFWFPYSIFFSYEDRLLEAL